MTPSPEPTASELRAAADLGHPLSDRVVAVIGRVYSGTVGAMALVCLWIGAGLIYTLGPDPWRLGLCGVALAVALLCVWAVLRAHQRVEPLLFCTLGVGAVLLSGGMAVVWGDGLHNPLLGFAPLLICLLCAMTSTRMGVLLASAHTALILCLALSGLSGYGPGAVAQTASAAVWMALVFHLMLIAAGISNGWLIALTLRHFLGEAAHREQRFRELFTRSPSPLVLHRAGQVITANDAAVGLFEFADIRAMRRTNLLDLFAPGDSRQSMERRALEFETLPVGHASPVMDYEMHAMNGRHILVQGVSVRVNADQGPATLSILLDMSARMAAEAALRRSQALLSTLFDASPDCLTLAELHTGRYALVNDSFVRLTGYTADEVLGKTPAEIALWGRPSDGEHLMGFIHAQGRVDALPALLRTKEGYGVSVVISAAAFEMDGASYLVMNARDVTVTERARLEHEAMLKHASVGIALTRDQHFVHTNPHFEHMFGWADRELIGRAEVSIWTDQSTYADISATMVSMISAGKAFEMERQMKRRDGSLFWARLMAQVVDPNDPSRGGMIWVTEDVSERRQIDQALAAARDAAEAASRAKSAFLANISHEVRTPLHGLLGLAHLASQDGVEHWRRQQFLLQMVESAKSLNGIITDVLDLSKIEAGKFTIEAIAFGLTDTLRSVRQTYQPLAENKGLRFSLTIDPTVPDQVVGDPLRVRQILSNYITNAIKFTDRGEVQVQAVSTPANGVRLSVTDTGLGISEATQAELFTPFTQADGSTTRRYGGTGLGLSVCRELAVLMGGKVGVKSQPGCGSTFWAELPLRAVPYAEPCAQAIPPDIAQSLVGKRVLMAEDNPVNMMIAVALLEEWGVQVTQASDGALALQAIEDAHQEGEPFDAVLMDLHMPVMSGEAAVRLLRAQPHLANLPVIALTAAALMSEREEALAAGMNAFLTKPIDSGRLRTTLLELVRG
jgi:PAS domain S-box-containing protein